VVKKIADGRYLLSIDGFWQAAFKNLSFQCGFRQERAPN